MTVARRLVSRATTLAPQPLMDFVYKHRFNPVMRRFRDLALKGLGDTENGIEIVRGPLAGMVLAFEDVPAEWSGIHEPEIQDFLLGEIRAGDVVYDIGAHVGYYVLLAAKALAGTGRIVAYEPEPRTFELMDRTVRRNDLDEMVDRRCVALGAEKGRGSIGFEDSSSYAQVRMTEGGDIEVTTLDQEVAAGLPTPSLIIIDTEGFEEKIFDGAHEVLTTARPRILAEHHDRREVLIAQLDRYGYSPRDLDIGHLFFEPH